MLIRVLSITRKGFLHIIRDPRVLAVMFLIPVIQLVLLGYAATTEVVQQALGGRLEAVPGIEVHPRVWYNPTIESPNFMIPGLIGVILSMLTILLAAMSIVREREQGIIEELVVVWGAGLRQRPAVAGAVGHLFGHVAGAGHPDFDGIKDPAGGREGGGIGYQVLDIGDWRLRCRMCI